MALINCPACGYSLTVAENQSGQWTQCSCCSTLFMPSVSAAFAGRRLSRLRPRREEISRVGHGLVRAARDFLVRMGSAILRVPLMLFGYGLDPTGSTRPRGI